LDEAALFIDLNDEKTFVKAVIALKNESVRNKLIKKGFSQLESINSKRKVAEKQFVYILEEYQTRLQCWAK